MGTPARTFKQLWDNVHGQFRIGSPQFFHPICPHLISTVGELRCNIAIMQEKHQHVLFEI